MYRLGHSRHTSQDSQVSENLSLLKIYMYRLGHSRHTSQDSQVSENLSLSLSLSVLFWHSTYIVAICPLVPCASSPYELAPNILRYSFNNLSHQDVHVLNTPLTEVYRGIPIFLFLLKT